MIIASAFFLASLIALKMPICQKKKKAYLSNGICSFHAHDWQIMSMKPRCSFNEYDLLSPSLLIHPEGESNYQRPVMKAWSALIYFS